ncbi:MAG: FG-GAP repeat protein [Phycisphaerales bacterium]
MKRTLSFLALISVFCYCPPVAAQCDPEHIQEIRASDEALDNEFGFSVDISGDNLVIGAIRGDSGSDDDTGAAYLFTLVDGEWTEVAKLLSSDPEDAFRFAWSVAIDDCSVAVGNRFGSAVHGAVHLFEPFDDTWREVAILTASDGAELDEFGAAVTVQNEIIAIGAPNHGAGAEESGAAYVFSLIAGEWAQTAEIAPLDPREDQSFGYAIDLSRDTSTLVAGAWRDSQNGSRAGAAYVFDRDGEDWTQVVKLLPDDPNVDDRFGGAVAICDSTVVVGAPADDDLGSFSGSVYVFELLDEKWTQVAKLLASDGESGDFFGRAVAISNGRILIGGGNSAYLFEKDSNGNWVQIEQLEPPGTANSFGNAVALDGQTALIGDNLRYINGDPSVGAAHIYNLNCGTPATLTDFTFTRGSLVNGDLNSLIDSDDNLLRGRSAFGFLSSEPNILDLHVGAATGIAPAEADAMHITVESRCNNPNCTVKWRLMNHDTNSLDEVHQYLIGTTEFREAASVNAPTSYIRAGDGRIELSIKKVVIATFSVTGFRAEFDEVAIAVD